MKTLPAISFLAALVAFVLFPATLALSGSILFGACLMTIFVADCAKTIKPVDVHSNLVTFTRPARRAAAFELAA